MIRLFGSMAMVIAVLTAIAGCEPGRTVIPPGAEQVHVDATGAVIRLDPATIRAGDVYLVVDLPAGGADLAIIGGTGGALSDADLSRLAAGDLQGTSLVSIDNSCCGNVHKMILATGKYAFVLHAQQVGPGRPPSAMTVLDVTP